MVDRDSIGLSRRKFLIGSGVSMAGTGAISVTASSETPRQFVVEQGEMTYEIEPLRTGETVEEFYSYQSDGHPHSHMGTNIDKSDSSELFLWDGPNGLSLVAQHDRRYDTGGGDVTFAFSGLPDDGEWAVRDDNPGNDVYTSNTEVEWHWGSDHTDGAAYRGLDGEFEVTIEPSFYSGINQWRLLSGDAASPDVEQLDMNQPVTIRGVTDDSQSELGEEFTRARNEKLGLAAQIDSVSTGLTDQQKAKKALETLESTAKEQNIPEERAVEAIERMKIGESLTETSFTGATTAVPRTNDEFGIIGRETTLASPYDVLINAGDALTDVLLGVLLKFKTLKGLIKKIPFSDWLVSKSNTRVSSALDWLKTALFKWLPINRTDGIFDIWKENGDDVISEIAAFIENTAGLTAKEVLNEKRELSNPVAVGLRDISLNTLFFDQVVWNGTEVGTFDFQYDDEDISTIDEGLDRLHNQLGGDGTEPDLSGSTQQTASAVDDIRSQIDSTYDTAADVMDTLSTLSLFADTVSLAITVISPFVALSGIGTALVVAAQTILESLATLSSVASVGTAWTTMLNVRVSHHRGIDAVISGGRPR